MRRKRSEGVPVCDPIGGSEGFTGREAIYEYTVCNVKTRSREDGNMVV